jgi:transposase
MGQILRWNCPKKLKARVSARQQRPSLTQSHTGGERNGDHKTQTSDCVRMVHTRRKFYDIHVATKSPLAEQALRRIAELYAIEADIRGRTADERRAIRQERSRPLVEAMQAWLTETLNRISGRSALAQAIRYALNHWSGLVLFLDDGRLELDTNTVERAMRPVALGRKNALFAGADSGGKHWALIATLIQTAKLNELDPLAWLTDVLERIVSGQTKRNELPTLLPWNWKPVCRPATLSSA